ncbi:hypothetical protein ACHAWT_004446 [Skeletonema menzelii]
MSMRRVSSRPRLVSDADRASQISSFMKEENYDTSTLSLSLDTTDIENCCKGDYSYFLFGHDDTDDVNGGTIQEVEDDDDNERKKSAAATATTATDNNDDKATTTTTGGGDSDHYPKRNTSDDTLSDYASCCCCCTDEDEETTTTTSDNVTNLEMSFQKSSLSSNEDEGGMEVAAASYLDRQLLATSTSTTITACTKRKRLSQQHYLTPNSSYAELQQQQQNSSNMMWYSPSSPVRGGGYSASYNIGVGQPPITSRMQHPHYCFTNNTTNHHHHHHHQKQQQHSPTQTNTPNKPTTPIQTLPEETLIQICTHLTHNDIRSIGSTCHYIRMVVTRSTCAIETLWMGWLIGRFPVVFGATNAADNDDDDDDGRVVEKRRSSSRRRRRRMHSSHVTFVDDFELPMAASPSPSASATTTTATGFVGVDHDIRNNNSVNLPLLTGLLAPRYPQLMNLRQGGEELPFRCFTRNIPRATTTTTTTATVGVNNSPMMDGEEGNDIDDDVVVLSVIQFTGRVGTGDRSIRSDFPFPPNCRTVGSSSSGSSSGSSHGGGASLKSLSTWMKNHTPLRSRGNKRKNGRAPAHSMVRDLSPPPTQSRLNNRQFLTLSNANYPLHAGRSLHLPLSSHSANNNERSPLFRFLSSLSHHCDCVSSSNTSSFVDNNEAEDDDVNDINSTVSLEQNHSGDHDDDDDEIGVNDYGMMIRHNGNGLLEQCKQKLGYNNKSIKDNLRPFVVPTVVSSSSSSGEVTVDLTPRLVAYFEVTILDQRSRNNDGRNVSQQQQQQQPPPPPPHHNAALRQHRGYLPRPRRRNVPFGGHRVFHQHAILAPPLDAQDRLARQGQVAVAPMRHECVAIGLSTLSFNPRSKMPGWCEHSFGYHGDDGGIFHGHGDMLRRYGPSFGPGDIVGCGLDYSTLKIFFVKNGEFLGWAFEKIEKEMVERGLYPTVGVDTECPIHVNFGEVPFKFDLKGFGREKLYW